MFLTYRDPMDRTDEFLFLWGNALRGPLRAGKPHPPHPSPAASAPETPGDEGGVLSMVYACPEA